ncbi:MAG: hypothetical protein ACR2RE_02755 [Geminicoccaceae bacterium]
MSERDFSITRYRTLEIAIAVGCCDYAAGASNTKSVDQITDLSATAATNIFRFEPNVVRLPPGDEMPF